MFAIFQKEFSSFFSSIAGYVVVSIFLVITGLFLWVLHETILSLNFNVLDYGYATLDTFFYLAPYVFMFLIPAVTMKMFSEEKKSGTLEILITRPVTELQIILGKYFAALLLVFISLIPTLLYYFTVYQLGSPTGNLDAGATWGSYIGLLLLAAAFVAIGIFASSITDNQIVAFIVAALLCFACLSAFDAFIALGLTGGKANEIIQSIGIQAHYTSISRGVIDSRDVIYFISLTSLFILFTKSSVESRKWK